MNPITYAILYCVVGGIAIAIGLRYTPREKGNNPWNYSEFGKNRSIAIFLVLLPLLPEAIKALCSSETMVATLTEAIKQVATIACAGLAGAYMAKGYVSPPTRITNSDDKNGEGQP